MLSQSIRGPFNVLYGQDYSLFSGVHKSDAKVFEIRSTNKIACNDLIILLKFVDIGHGLTIIARETLSVFIAAQSKLVDVVIS